MPYVCIVKIIVAFFSVLLLAGCAQVGTLTGGDKDVVPPKLLKSFPANEALDFNQQRIELQFNEFVQLKNIQQQLVISPPVSSFPKLTVKGKKVILLFDTLFRENTTYSLFFGEGIVDYTEGNAWPNGTLVFATGSRLDFLKVEGTVKNSYDGLPESDMLVLLYPSDAPDSCVAKSLPAYFGKSDKSGHFAIHNIHEGNYKTFALKDLNNNYRYDQPNEKIGFLSTPLSVKDTLTKVSMATFSMPNKRQFLSTQKLMNEKTLLLSFNAKSKDKMLSFESEERVLHHKEMYNDGDSLVLWLRKDLTPADSLVLRVKSSDFSDTLTYFLKDAKSIKNLPIKLLKESKVPLVVPGDSLYFAFNFPLDKVDPAFIQITQDSATIPFGCALSSPRKLAIKSKALPAKSCKVKFFPGALNDIYGRSNLDTIVSSFTLPEESAFGSLLLKVNVSEAASPFVLQLLSSHQEVVKEEMFSAAAMTFDYKNLTPDEYTLKLIFDGNQNKSWDSGNYYQQVQPEKIVFYEKSLTVRANWEMEIEWNVIAR